MTQAKLIKITLISLVFTILFCFISYQWLDAPIVTYLAAHHAQDWPWAVHIRWAANILSFFPEHLLLPSYLYIGLRLVFGQLRSYENRYLLLLNMTIIGFYGICNNTFREFLGRAWPSTWTHHNPSFLSNGIYGFHLGLNNSAYETFPSGHALLAATLATFAWFYLKKWRWWVIAYSFFVSFIMVIQHYHFLSDVIAGMEIGYLVTICTYFYINKKPNLN